MSGQLSRSGLTHWLFCSSKEQICSLQYSIVIHFTIKLSKWKKDSIQKYQQLYSQLSLTTRNNNKTRVLAPSWHSVIYATLIWWKLCFGVVDTLLWYGWKDLLTNGVKMRTQRDFLPSRRYSKLKEFCSSSTSYCSMSSHENSMTWDCLAKYLLHSILN